MKNPFLTLAFLALSSICFASTNNPLFPAKKDAAAGTFAHHCGEFHITPSADYYFYAKGKNYEMPDPYQYRVPFIGFDIGGTNA